MKKIEIGFLYEELIKPGTGIYNPAEDFKVVTIVEFYKKEGDAVVAGEPLFSFESDKGVEDFLSPVNGKIVKIYYQAGQRWYFKGYEEKTPLGKIVTPYLLEIESQDFTNFPVQEKFESEKDFVETRNEEKDYKRKITPVAKNIAKAHGFSEEDIRRRTDKDSRNRITKSEVEKIITTKSSGTILAVPSARRFAREYGIPLEAVIPSRKDGVIMRCDVEKFLADQQGTIQEQLPQQQDAVDSQVLLKEYPNEQIVYPDKVRLEIARMLSLSWQKIPHAGDMIEVDVSRLAKAREQYGKLFQKITGTKLRFDNFFLFFAAQNLLKPEFKPINAYWDDDDPQNKLMRYVGTVNLGIAVDTGYGLVVPVIRSAEKLRFAELAKAVEDIAARAKSKKLKSSEFRELTFTVNNVGALGGEEPNMIIPYTKRDDGTYRPTCMILGIGRIKKDGLRHIAKVAMKFDHRIVDAKAPLSFLLRLKQYCEEGDIESLFEI